MTKAVTGKASITAYATNRTGGHDVPYFDSLDDEIDFYTKGQKKSKNTARRPQKRKVQYVSAGHTKVTYAHRVLNIRFKESPEEYRKKVKRVRNETKTARPTRSGIYRNKYGTDVTAKVNRQIENYDTVQRHKALKTDKYSIEDMRSLLRDDHWEEVCGHKRWNYDSNSTVKEFKKYLSRNKGRH